MINRQMKNERGFTLIEMLLAMTLGIVLLAATVYTYTKQESVLLDENSSVQLRDFARLTMDELVPNLRLAGFGLPPGDSSVPRPAQGITAATATSVTYRANLENDSTLVAFDSGVGANGFLMPTGGAANFAADEHMVFFNTGNPAEWGEEAISSAGVTTVTVLGTDYDKVIWDGGNTNTHAFSPVASGIPVLINHFHTITYTYNSGPQTITMIDDMGTAATGDDVTTLIANNVSSLTFTYFDVNGNTTAVVGNIRKIGISLIVVDAVESTLTARLDTDVHLRNMGL